MTKRPKCQGKQLLKEFQQMKNLDVKKRRGQADAVEYSVGMCWQVSFNDLKFKDPDWTSTPHLRLQYHITRVHRWKCLQLVRGVCGSPEVFAQVSGGW